LTRIKETTVPRRELTSDRIIYQDRICWCCIIIWQWFAKS